MHLYLHYAHLYTLNRNILFFIVSYAHVLVIKILYFTACALGRYGQNCSEGCSANCLNPQCNHETGECIDGCKDGWQGFNCTHSVFLLFKDYIVLIIYQISFYISKGKCMIQRSVH